MDALANAALLSLLKDVLPRLQERLKTLSSAPAKDRTPSLELSNLLAEAQELMTIMGRWSSPEKTEQTPEAPPSGDDAMVDDLMSVGAANQELSDDEALRLLAEMDGPVTEQAAPAPTTTADTTAKELSDEEAMRLLAEMDAPAASPTPAPAAALPSAAKAASAADEAAALLAALGGDDGHDEARTPAPKEEQGHDDDHEDFGEIQEWEANDFQNDPDMLNDFNTNCDETMQKIDETILRMEQEPENKELIEEIFRGAHTLKGAAGMFGFRALERVMHRTENLFDLIRKGKLHPSSDVVDVMLESMDTMRALLNAVKAGKPCGIKTGHVVKALTLVARGKRVAKAATGASEAKASHGEGGSAATPKPGATGSDKKNEVSTIRVDLERLDALVNLVGELVIDRGRFASIEEELRTNHPQVKLHGNLSETVQIFGRHMNEFQDIIMKVRMVPIGNAFNKFTRVVRDLSKQLDKKIDLHISGESAELDKTMVEQIGDPLIHLIRNSCDHGIETPADRRNKGKSEVGNIYLSAAQEGNHIVIKIEDDGKGIPVEVIRKKGIEKGLIKEDDKLSQRDIFNLIFEPGFSTAEKVTNVSGRGVGMDVVKKQIMKLKGLLEIDSVKDRGTTISIRLPLTLAIVQSLLVSAKSETFAVPLSSVIESIRIEPKDIQRVGDAEVIKLRDKVLPLMHLDEALRLERKASSLPELLRTRQAGSHCDLRRKHGKLFVVVVGHADRPFGIVVDQLLNQQEMVIKPMGSLMRHIPCVAGGAVLGNGEVVLVLDVPELEQSFSTKARNAA